MLEASCLFWTKQCQLLSADSVVDHLNQPTLDPMVALGYFITNHTPCLFPPQHKAYPTLMMLYSIAREILSKEDSTKTEKAKLIYRLEKAKIDFKAILDENDSHSSNKKTRQHAEEGIRLIEKVQKDLKVGSGSNEDDNTIAKYTLEDAQFIVSLTKPGKNKNWKDIFNKGKAKGNFKSYKSSDSLKSSYYHIQRRKKQKGLKKLCLY